MSKEIRQLVRELTAQGFETRRTKKNHLSVRRGGRVVAILAGTPSDWRSHRNSLADLRRAGFQG